MFVLMKILRYIDKICWIINLLNIKLIQNLSERAQECFTGYKNNALPI